jgi:hypothetical protein
MKKVTLEQQLYDRNRYFSSEGLKVRISYNILMLHTNWNSNIHYLYVSKLIVV